MKHVFKTLAGVLLAGISTASFAQSLSPVGTYSSDFGELRLKTNANFVYGDYANLGHFEGFVKAIDGRGTFVRARFERKDGYVGYVEWMLREYEGEGQQIGLRGRYAREGTNVPNQIERRGGKWDGERRNNAVPTLTTYTGSPRIAPFLADHGREMVGDMTLQSWLSFGDIAPPPPSSPWTGTWDTDYGEVRLVQAGSGGPVYGDYGNIGTIRGVSRVIDGTHILRARFDRDDGQQGYVEWASSGNSDKTLSGVWNWASRTPPSWDKSSSGTKWNATRTETKRPTIQKFSGNIHDRNTLTLNDAKYAEWIQFKSPKPAASTSTVDTSSAGQLTPRVAPADPLREKFPSLESQPASFQPRYIEVDLESLSGKDNYIEIVTVADYITEFYGRIGIYLYCETDASTRSLPPTGGVGNRVWDVARGTSVKVGSSSYNFPSGTKRRFLIDQACLQSDDGRFSLQLQTNMKEKDTIPALDDVWGYRGQKVYLDEPDTEYRSNTSDDFTIWPTADQSDLRFSFKASENAAVTDANNRFFRISGKIRFVE